MNANGVPLLELIGIDKSYRSSDNVPPTIVLRDLNLRVHAGESVAVVGPSGSGKSTLLNIIGTLDRPDSGRVVLEGTDLATLSDDALAQVRSREIGFVFQLHHLLPQCTVLENVLLPTLAGKGSRPRIEPAEARARRLLDRVGLGERLMNRPGQLSGGERQRTAVVRALINEPKLLLADEPTGALDGSNAENLAALLLELNREEGVALLTITHALDLAEQMGTTYELRDGSLRRRGDSR
ncbi:MAG: ABC transporter ATP-binding protein [Fibrella sp.]|nr:ABC transporter ATP-binding protein [Armatimonadota bacterium]